MTLTKIFILATCLFSFELYAQETVSIGDFNIILGDWKGKLTYLDYRSNKPYTMPANLEVKKGRNENYLLLFNSYPIEPKANNKDKMRVSKNGMLLNGHSIASNQKLSNGRIQITTQYYGKDNNEKSLIRIIYSWKKQICYQKGS